MSTARADLNVYQINSSDEIIVDITSGGRSTFKNAGGTTRRGTELSAGALLNPNLRASVAANWINAEFTQGSVNPGSKIPGIPQNFVFSELLWTSVAADTVESRTQSSRLRNNIGTRVALELIHSGRLFANDTNTESAAGYTNWNLMASQGWAVGRANLTAYARVDNLLDERYVGSVIVNQASAKFYEPAPGRNWTVGLRYRLPIR
jgi:iron complex outermembrane receptor protein